jgi:hypothetical protein
MAGKKRTAGTTALYQELPSDLVQRLRDFARRDQRTLKVELIRAIELLLATYDTGAEKPTGGAAPAPSATPTPAKKPRARKKRE